MANAALAFLAWKLGGLDRSGAATGMVLGALLYVALGLGGYSLLVAFYILGTVATRLGFARKSSLGVAQSASGRRSARHVLANAGVALGWALVAWCSPGLSESARMAFAAALATATGDTLASELGQLAGGRTRLIVGLLPVPPGTDGGVSLWGSAAGAGGALVIGGLGAMWNLYPVAVAGWIALAGIVGVFADSLLGATLERRGSIGNEGVNVIATLAGSLSVLGMVCVASGVWE